MTKMIFDYSNVDDRDDESDLCLSAVTWTGPTGRTSTASWSGCFGTWDHRVSIISMMQDLKGSQVVIAVVSIISMIKDLKGSQVGSEVGSTDPQLIPSH